MPRRIPVKIASQGKPGIAAPPLELNVIIVELRVITEVAVVREVELTVEVIESTALEVAVTVEFTVEVDI
jgi:hypothetical protein